jgi:hypothetical protein
MWHICHYYIYLFVGAASKMFKFTAPLPLYWGHGKKSHRDDAAQGDVCLFTLF